MSDRVDDIRDAYHAATGGDLPVAPAWFETVCIGALVLSVPAKKRWWSRWGRIDMTKAGYVATGEVLAQRLWPEVLKRVAPTTRTDAK